MAEVDTGKPGKIFTAIPAIMGELAAVGKDSSSENLRYKYRSIDDLYNALNPLMVKHRVFTVPTILSEKFESEVTRNGGSQTHAFLKIQFRFYSDDGSFFDAVVMGEGTDSGDKASNKAESFGHKYALTQVFMVRTQDQADPDSESPPPPVPKDAKPKATAPQKPPAGGPRRIGQLSDKQIVRLYAIGGARGWGEKDIHAGIEKKWKLKSVKELTRAQYDELCNWLLELPVVKKNRVGSDDDIRQAAEETT